MHSTLYLKCTEDSFSLFLSCCSYFPDSRIFRALVLKQDQATTIPFFLFLYLSTQFLSHILPPPPPHTHSSQCISHWEIQVWNITSCSFIHQESSKSDELQAAVKEQFLSSFDFNVHHSGNKHTLRKNCNSKTNTPELIRSLYGLCTIWKREQMFACTKKTIFYWHFLQPPLSLTQQKVRASC